MTLEHQQVVSGTEKKILDHLVHHHPNSEIYKELNQLRSEDAKHGQNFHNDLRKINRQLHWDTALAHLPSVTLEEHGKNFRIKNDAEVLASANGAVLPAAVKE